MTEQLPSLLTVEEAARVLRIGRTKAYDMAREWRATDGRSGLPVIDFGNVLRVPRRQLEAMLGGSVGPVDVAGEGSGVVPASLGESSPAPTPTSASAASPPLTRRRSNVASTTPTRRRRSRTQNHPTLPYTD